MKKIKLTEEQEKEHPFAKELIELFNKYSGDELLESLDAYVLEVCSYSADMLNKQVLLGETALYGPDEWDDWTKEEKLKLFDRWDIINRIVALSKAEMLMKKLENEDDEAEEREDPNRNNGKGMVS